MITVASISDDSAETYFSQFNGERNEENNEEEIAERDIDGEGTQILSGDVRQMDNSPVI